jgi:NAD(P)-dependent dehydrogenase (short-subunit alcohol dehydrogenase family)
MISSVSAIMGTKGYTIYGAVKGAMLGLLKSLAAELSPNVRVNAILPGGVRTRTTNFLYENQESPNPRYLLGDGEPVDIANMIEFLMSDRAKWITGQEFVVDGGLTSN